MKAHDKKKARQANKRVYFGVKKQMGAQVICRACFLVIVPSFGSRDVLCTRVLDMPDRCVEIQQYSCFCPLIFS